MVEQIKGVPMLTTYLLIGLTGIIAGGVGAAAIIKKEEPAPAVQPIEQVATQQQEIIKQLTDIDLLSEPCSVAYMEKNSDILCREMFCRMMTRGIDSQTSGKECESIGNIANSYFMVEHCAKLGDKSDECFDKYRERK